MVLLAGACGTSGDPESDSAGSDELADPTGQQEDQVLSEGDGTYEVRTVTFTDATRDTRDEPGRDLTTDIYVPGGDGPFPLIVHAHGLAGSSAKFSDLLGKWAGAGYVVVAPNFPLTNDGVPEDERDLGDYRNQPGDLRHVLDEVLEMNSPGGELEGLVSEDHIGISGLSLGGATTYPTLFHSCCADERYRAAILMSALEMPFEPGAYDYEGSGPFPVLAFAGTSDDAIPYDLQQSIIAKLPGPTWNVTLHDGEHAAPFENQQADHDDLVVASTLAFWAHTLRDSDEHGPQIFESATVPGLSSVEHSP